MHVRRQGAYAAAGTCAALILAAWTSPWAWADDYPPTPVRVVAGTVSLASVQSGGSLTFAGTGFAPGSQVRLSVDGIAAGIVTANAVGAFSTTLLMSGTGLKALAASGLEKSHRLRVVAAQVTVTAPTGNLPHTGSGRTLPSLLLGFGLVTGGATVTLAARSRGHRRAA